MFTVIVKHQNSQSNLSTEKKQYHIDYLRVIKIRNKSLAQ